MRLDVFAKRWTVGDIVRALWRRPFIVGLLVVYVAQFLCVDAPYWRLIRYDKRVAARSALEADGTDDRFAAKDGSAEVGDVERASDGGSARWLRLVTYKENLQVGEAQAWWRGRLDLPERLTDTAVFEGKIYNVYPPLFTLIAALVVAFIPDGVPHIFLSLVLSIPASGLAYVLFRRRVSSNWLAVLLAVGLICGTSFSPVLVRALRWCSVYPVNHILAVMAMLVLLVEFFGRRRLWVLGLAFTAGCWSRQLTAFYFPLLVYAVMRTEEVGLRRRRWWGLAGWLALTAGVPMLFHTAKFGDPFETGYRYIYVGRDDPWSRDAARGLFSPVFLPRNLYYLNLGFPEIREAYGQRRIWSNCVGTGIWWTSPILVLVFVRWRDWWREKADRLAMACAAVVFVGILLYHVTGRGQCGYSRVSLDFVPVFMAVLAPSCERIRRKGWLVACVAWSVLYFGFLV